MKWEIQVWVYCIIDSRNSNMQLKLYLHSNLNLRASGHGKRYVTFLDNKTILCFYENFVNLWQHQNYNSKFQILVFGCP